MMNWLNLVSGEMMLDIAPEAGGSIARFRLGEQDLMAFVGEDFREQFPDPHFVVHNQNRCHCV